MAPLITNQVLAQHAAHGARDLEERGATENELQDVLSPILQSTSVPDDVQSHTSSIPSLLPPQDDDSSCDPSAGTCIPIQAYHLHNNNLSAPCNCPDGLLFGGGS